MLPKRTPATNQSSEDSLTDLGSSDWQPTGYTGIAGVDALLDPVLKNGGVVLVSGYTGSGKTCLASQIAVCLTAAGKQVRYLSTEVENKELLVRTLSCAAGWPIRDLERYGVGFEEMAPGILKPILGAGNDEFTVRTLAPYQRLRRHLRFNYLHDFRVDPIAALNEAMAEVGEDVDCIILDHLWLNGIVDGRTVDQTKLATDVMAFLAMWAEGLHIPIFVFCQRNAAGEGQDNKEVKAGRVGGISEFPRIEPLADATIELTYPVTRPTERLEVGAGTYSAKRHFIISTTGNGRPQWVPVLAAMDCQRFIARDDDCEVGSHESERDFRRRVLNSERQGYIKFPREVWEDLQEIGHPPSRIVYVAMVIAANQHTGCHRWTGLGLEELLNYDDSVIRRALLNLEARGLVACLSKKGPRQRRTWQIVDYLEKFQNPEIRDYVVLARTLFDEKHADLRHDNKLFAIWLTLLFETRFSADTDGFLQRGQWPAGYSRLETMFKTSPTLKMNIEEVKAAFQKLERQGRIDRWTDSEWNDEIVMLRNYDRYQRQVPWSKADLETDEGVLNSLQ